MSIWNAGLINIIVGILENSYDHNSFTHKTVIPLNYDIYTVILFMNPKKLLNLKFPVRFRYFIY